jgi:F-type H+-transporting ATPase subunit a
MPKKMLHFQRPFFAFIALMMAMVASKPVMAQDYSHIQDSIVSTHDNEILSEEKESGFDAGKMIMHHIADAHEIHIIGDFAIYLPVILYTDQGIKVFSSSHFYHNEKHITTIDENGVEQNDHYYAYDGYVMYHEHVYKADENGSLSIDSETGEVTNAGVFDLSITKSVAGIFLTVLLLLLIFLSVAKSYGKREGKAPKGLQSFMEPLILFIRDEVAIPSMGAKSADKFLPFLLTIFFFIWIANMLGLIPFIGGFNVTGTLSVTLVLAAIVFIITTINGNKHYWGHIFWPPGVPLPIKFILVPIEIASIFIKPLVLMIRLTANITAGHIIILAFVSLVLIFGQTSATAGYGVGVGSVLFMVFMFFIELLVAFLQAYVFTLLAALYFGDATQEAHH